MLNRKNNLIVHNEPSFSVTLTPNDFKFEALPLLLSIIPVDTFEVIKAYSVLYKEKIFKTQIIPLLQDILELDTSKVIKGMTNIGFYTRFTPIKIYRDANYDEISNLNFILISSPSIAGVAFAFL